MARFTHHFKLPQQTKLHKLPDQMNSPGTRTISHTIAALQGAVQVMQSRWASTLQQCQIAHATTNTTLSIHSM